MLGFTGHHQDHWIVCAIIAILFAIAIPNLFQARRAGLRKQALAPYLEQAERAREAGKLPSEAQARAALPTGLVIAQVDSSAGALGGAGHTVVWVPADKLPSKPARVAALAVDEGWLLLPEREGALGEPELRDELPLVEGE